MSRLTDHHLGLDDDAAQDASANRDVAGERTLLVDVRALARLRDRERN